MIVSFGVPRPLLRSGDHYDQPAHVRRESASSVALPERDMARTQSRRVKAPVRRAPSASGLDWLLAAAVGVSGLLLLRSTRDNFHLPRITALVLLAAAIVGVAALRSPELLRRPVRRPRWTAIVVGCFVAALLVATAVAPSGLDAVLGAYGRYTGLLLYLSCVVFFLAAAAQRAVASIERLATVATVVAGVALAYGFLQAVGLDVFDWPGTTVSTIFSTFGQVNFAAGFVPIGLPFLVHGALRADRPAVARAVCAGVAVAGLYFAARTGSAQAVLGLVAAAVPFLYYLTRRRWREQQPRRVTAVILGALLAAAALAVAIPPLRRALSRALDTSLDERILLWRTALSMFRDSPLVGQGLGSYGELFVQFRPDEHAVTYAYGIADAPHSVPLEMLATGGILLSAAYVAFVGLVFVEGFRALRRGSLLATTLASAWLGYQAQSLVSLDVPSHATMHWILAGSLVALNRIESTPAAPRGSRAAAPGRPVARPPALVAGAGMLAAILVGIPMSRPFRADLAAGSARGHAQAGRGAEALADLDRATDLAAWEGTYWADRATVLQVVGQPTEALASGDRAVDNSPGAINYLAVAARLAGNQRETERAQRAYMLAVRRDPQNVTLLLEAGTYLMRTGRPEEGVELVEQADELVAGDEVRVLVLLLEGYRRTGQKALDDRVYRRLLELSPADVPDLGNPSLEEGRTLLASGDAEGAAKALARAARAEPDRREILQLLEQAYRESGDEEAAYEVRVRLAAIPPTSAG